MNTKVPEAQNNLISNLQGTEDDNNSPTEPLIQTSSNIKAIVGGKEVEIGNARFIEDRRILVSTDGIDYTYVRTKKEHKGKIYFQCVNRQRRPDTGKKCLAKANYVSATKTIEVIDLHNPKCNNLKLSVQDDFQSQKQDILVSLESNKALTIVNAMTLLRDKNNEAPQENKRQPLTYEQVKKIIRDFREENNINSNDSFFDPLHTKTLDKAILIRCHNKYNLMYKNKLIVNEYIVFCSPFMQSLLSITEHWQIDSTFYIVPHYFYQLLVILIYNDIVDAHVPACFVLLSTKNQYIYEKVFKDIREFILEDCFEVKRITLDFEKSEKIGISKAFPNVEFLGCKFHFIQALVRKAKKQGLMNQTNEEETRDIFHQINNVLENQSKSLEQLLEEMAKKYEIPNEFVKQEIFLFY